MSNQMESAAPEAIGEFDLTRPIVVFMERRWRSSQKTIMMTLGDESVMQYLFLFALLLWVHKKIES